MMTPTSIISLWPDSEQFARDIGLANKDYVRVMRHRNRIPRVWWPDVVKAARKRGFGVTKDMLKQAHAEAGSLKPHEAA